MRDFRKLKIWQRSHNLTLDVYKTTANFPKEERYGLTSQLRRACASVPTNIAEGSAMSSDREFARYVEIAAGSASETEYLLFLARDLRIIAEESYRTLASEITQLRKMLNTFKQRLDGRSSDEPPTT